MAFGQKPSDRELNILKVLWQRGPSTVRQVTEVICEREYLAQNTIQTFLRLMEDKGLVAHEEPGRAFVYRALYQRSQVVKGFIASIFDGAIDQLVVHAVDGGNLSDEQLAKIEAKIRALREEQK
jgi:predicted transcriptional regulator